MKLQKVLQLHYNPSFNCSIKTFTQHDLAYSDFENFLTMRRKKMDSSVYGFKMCPAFLYHHIKALLLLEIFLASNLGNGAMKRNKTSD